MEIKSGPELSEAYYLLKHGANFQLSMGYKNGLLKKMGVLFYQGVQPDFRDQSITLNFAGYLRAMNVGEKDRVLKGKTIQQVLQTIVSDYAVLELGEVANGNVVISETVSQSKKSDFDLLQEIASSFGLIWDLSPSTIVGKWVISLKKMNWDDDSSKYESMYTFPDKENQDIVNNIHLVDFKPKSNVLGDVPSSITIESNNPNQPIEVDNKVYNEDSYGNEVRGSEIVYTVFGEVNQVHFYENVSDDEAAQIIADQMFRMDELKFVQAKNTKLSEGNAGVRKGQRRHIVPHGIPLFAKVFEGDYLVTKTKHRIDNQSGYNTWFNANRESLTLPPPPELGGSGGGQPVVIWISENNVVQGWYVSFDEMGDIVYGAKITRSEILENSYWMSFVNSYTLQNVLNEFVASPLSEQYPGLASNPTNITQTGFSTVNIASASSPGNLQGIAVYIDFPEQWSNMPLAEDVREPSNTESTENYESWREMGFDSEFLSNLQQEALQQEFLATSQSLGIGAGLQDSLEGVEE